MKTLIKIFAISLLLGLYLLISCKPLDPSARYAKEHQDKEFKGWDQVEKDAKKEERWRRRQ